MPGLTYNTWLAALATALNRAPTNANLLLLLQDAIDYGEQRICRELQLITQITSNSAGTATAGNRNFTFPAHFVIAQDINIITPVGAVNADSGKRNALTRTTKEALDFLWPDVTGAGVPIWWAPLTDQSIVMGPWPDQPYHIEVVGTQRPLPLSPSNPTTFISQYLPDLFVMATLVFMSGTLQKNFSATGDEPQGPLTFEKQYQTLAASAKVEELKKMLGSAAG